jgi:hypothetical protein
MRGQQVDMAPTGRLDDRVAVAQGDAQQMLKCDLRKIEERLRVIVEACQERPSAIDGYILDSANSVISVETTIVQAHRVMNERVYAEDSPLRASSDIWGAFIEQKDEFQAFYVSALKALEIYKEVLLAYNLSKSITKPLLGNGDLERIRQDKRTHVDERQECITTISEFHSKFSAMLAVLADLPTPANIPRI